MNLQKEKANVLRWWIMGIVMVVGFLWLVLTLTLKPPADCPPHWKCNGSVQTNDPRCCEGDTQ